MKATDHHLERLLKAAAAAPPRPMLAPPSSLKARVLAHWRSSHAQPQWFEMLAMLRRGLRWVFVLALVTVGAAVVEIKLSTPHEWSFANTLVSMPWSTLR